MTRALIGRFLMAMSFRDPQVAPVVAQHIVPWPTTDPGGATRAHPADGV